MVGTPSDFRIENLVPGQENILAINGALKVLEEPGAQFNPLYVFGPPSVGKTHMLYGLRRALERQHPDWNLLALPAGEFLEECENAWQNRLTIEFRQQIWRLDALLIDDIHLLLNRPAALEELYHAFNRLVADNKQLVLTSRSAPGDMIELPTTLRSRFQSGLLVHLQPPRERLMSDIVEQKCEHFGITMARTAMQFLSKEVRNVRELHGVLHELQHKQNGNPQRINLEHVRGVLEKHAAEQMTVSEVAKAVCAYFHVDLPKVRSPCRQHALVQARQMAMYLAREFTTAPLTEIGEYFGGRDHTTVLYAYRKVSNEMRQTGFASRAAKDIQAILRG